MAKPLGDPTNRGSGESLGSLQEHAAKHSNWYDQYNAMFGKGVDDIDFSQREFDDNGRVKVTKYDILLGRSQPELQAAYEKQRQARVRNSSSNQAHRRTFDGQSAVPEAGRRIYAPNRINEEDIDSRVIKEEGRKTAVAPLLEELGRMEGGAVAVSELPSRPTSTQVASKIGELTPKQSRALAEAQRLAEELKTSKSNRTNDTERVNIARKTQEDNKDFNEGQLRIQGDQLNLNARIAYNDNVIAMRNSDIAATNAKNNTIQLENADKASQLDRELRRDLALLTREDNIEDRRYNREADLRKDRQMLILQLMQGLVNSGKALY